MRRIIKNYVVIGSEDGVIGVYSSKKRALIVAMGYVGLYDIPKDYKASAQSSTIRSIGLVDDRIYAEIQTHIQDFDFRG